MTTSDPALPDIAQILGPVLARVDPAEQPFLLARLERLAAQRYRGWAEGHADAEVRRGLLECADREEEIARRVESLDRDATEIQERILAENPDILEVNATLFGDLPLETQLALQAAGERAGASTWRAFAAASPDPAAAEVLQSCIRLEEENAEFLESLD